MNRIKRIFSFVTILVMALNLTSCAGQRVSDPEADHTIVLHSELTEDGSYTHTALLDGQPVTEYDYTWKVDPAVSHDVVKDCPAEYYTGTEPGDEAVYIAHDIFYYPELPEEIFVRVRYDGDDEWAYYYPTEEYGDYIFATLPILGNSLPASMMHSEEEAYQNAVLHITQAGSYRIEGEWHGQIWIDLGDPDETFFDESAKVTLILNGVDITCTVAPAAVFYSVYECCNAWEEQETHSATVDTTGAGANVVIADGTVNNVEGTNVYRMLKAKYKSDDASEAGVRTQKKARKADAAFYSYVSMNLDGGGKGDGVLNITGGYEGLDSELHLTINGGNLNIFSQDDGINVNEDDVSVLTVNGGTVHILAGLGSEGDGVDSNGYLVINGGTVISAANPGADSGLDSDCGSYINGGTVLALGSTMDWAEANDANDSGAVTMNLQFAESQSSTEAILVTDTDGKVVFAYDPDKDEVAGTLARSYRGAILSCAGLEVGKDYYVYVGGDVEGTETGGVYDPSTVTGFSEGAVQQCYAGTDLGGRGRGGIRPGGADWIPPEDGMNDFLPGITDNGDGTITVSEEAANSLLERAKRFNNETAASAEELMACTTLDEVMALLGMRDPGGQKGKTRPTPPDAQQGGFDPAQGETPPAPPERAEGAPAEGGFDPNRSPSDSGTDAETLQTTFTMTDKVNGFSGVRDVSAAAAPLGPQKAAASA
ncbi:MAG: carbohydrate-binding domain-containing protein [Clostridia bacterium]|nr:carbohydrate-binding domain-containing protein [Clostridia bacterium]